MTDHYYYVRSEWRDVYSLQDVNEIFFLSGCAVFKWSGFLYNLLDQVCSIVHINLDSFLNGFVLNTLVQRHNIISKIIS